MKILIIGAGIGGLTAAIALRRAGFDAQVFERAPALVEAGAGISVMANAARVLKHYGLLPALQESGEPLRAGVIQPNDGGPLMPPVAVDTDVPGFLLHRADLQAILAAPLPPECIRVGAELVDFQQDSDGVTARFGDGTEARGDLLIGSDGLRSVVRQRLMNDGPPIYRGYQCWRGVNPAGHVENLAEILGRGVRVGLVPMGRRGVAWWLCANEDEHASDAPEGRQAKLLRLLNGWHHSVRALIAGTPEKAILKSAIYDRAVRRGWSRGRVLLIGDAAHPTTPNLGQGGGMAIEDAALLARCLVHFDGHAEAFARFEALRFPRVKAIVARSLLWGRMGQWSHPLACWVRNSLLRVTPRSRVAKDIIDLMNYNPLEVAL